MRLHINGEDRQAPALLTVADLAAWMNLPAFGSAIELNGMVIRRGDYPTTPVAEGDLLEVIRLVGGG